MRRFFREVTDVRVNWPREPLTVVSVTWRPSEESPSVHPLVGWFPSPRIAYLLQNMSWRPLPSTTNTKYKIQEKGNDGLPNPNKYLLAWGPFGEKRYLMGLWVRSTTLRVSPVL